MLTKKELQEILDTSLDTGADFAEIFLEDTKSSFINVYNGDVINASHSKVHGVGVRLLKDAEEVYAYSNDASFSSVLKLVSDLKQSFNSKPNKVVKLTDKKPYVSDIKIPHDSMSVKDKSQKLIKLSNIIKNYDERILQGIANLVEREQKVLVANTNGTYQDDLRTYTRVVLFAVAQENDRMQESYEGPGRFMGLEIFDEIDFDQIALECAQSCILLLEADDMVPQTLPVVIHNSFGGVIFHEAVGHSLEATAIAKGLSPFAGKIGQKIASDCLTAYDNGDDPHQWGRVTYDDEGMKSQKNLLIENGILRNYLIDFRNSRKMNMKPTGSGRRQSYRYSPTSRMNSTYIANGTEDYEDIIKDTKYGLFAKRLGGGSVMPATGEYNFAVLEGYMIEDGKLTKPVRGATLIGHGAETIMDIDRVANNLSYGQGMCGSQSGSIPVDVGQPTIRVKKMIVGGKGSAK